VTDYAWDYEDRLTEVVVKTSGGTVLQDDRFTYDVEGRRIGKNMLGGGQTWTLYDGGNPYADFNSSGTLTYRYLYGKGLDSLLARFDGTNTVWYLTDNLGSVRQMVSTGGSVLDQLTYDSFGNILTETSPSSGDRFKFTGREWDSELGQYNYRARPYVPGTGRFSAQDPSGFNGGDANLYRYVGNSSTDATDPSGMSVWEKIWNGPNSAIGLVWGALGILKQGYEPEDLAQTTVDLGNNAIQFDNNPFMPEGSAITLGNVIIYGKNTHPYTLQRNGVPVGHHEREHTYQGEEYGPMYLPLHLSHGLYSLYTTGDWHLNNSLEQGPMSNPPHPWIHPLQEVPWDIY
jgi:RHS repeat-associated protein